MWPHVQRIADRQEFPGFVNTLLQDIPTYRLGPGEAGATTSRYFWATSSAEPVAHGTPCYRRHRMSAARACSAEKVFQSAPEPTHIPDTSALAPDEAIPQG